MNKNIYFWIILLSLLGCQIKEEKKGFYFNKSTHTIAEITIESKLVLYDIIDSTKTVFDIKKGKLVFENIALNYRLLKDSLFIYDTKKEFLKKEIVSFKSFINKKENKSIINTYWKLNDTIIPPITLYFSENEIFGYGSNNNLSEIMDYRLTKDFGKYNILLYNSSFFLPETLYLVSDVTKNKMILIDVKSSNHLIFERYISEDNSLINGNWKKISIKNEDDFCLEDYLKITKDTIFSKSKQLNDINNYSYSFGMDSNIIFIDACATMEVLKITKDSLIMYNHGILVPEYRTLKYIRESNSNKLD